MDGNLAQSLTYLYRPPTLSTFQPPEYYSRTSIRIYKTLRHSLLKHNDVRRNSTTRNAEPSTQTPSRSAIRCYFQASTSLPRLRYTRSSLPSGTAHLRSLSRTQTPTTLSWTYHHTGRSIEHSMRRFSSHTTRTTTSASPIAHFRSHHPWLLRSIPTRKSGKWIRFWILRKRGAKTCIWFAGRVTEGTKTHGNRLNIWNMQRRPLRNFIRFTVQGYRYWKRTKKTGRKGLGSDGFLIFSVLSLLGGRM